MRRKTKALRQETLIIIGAVLFLGVGAPLIYFAHTAESPIVITSVTKTTVEVPFTTLTRGRQSIVDRRVNYVLTSSKQLNEIWQIVNATGTPPRVDFKKQAVFVVFAGNESSSSIAVAKIEDANARKVSIAITKPDCTVPPSSASPYEIVAVPATSLPLTHEDLPTLVSCK